MIEIGEAAATDRSTATMATPASRGQLRNLGTIRVVHGQLRVYGSGTGLEEDGLSTGSFGPPMRRRREPFWLTA